jgi:hypothetical protein
MADYTNRMAEFQPGQILYLEHQQARLYTEVIQVVAARGICWVRPIALVVDVGDRSVEDKDTQHFANLEGIAGFEQVNLYDLRQSSDLLCPSSLFTPALDTEVISILATLNTPKIELETDSTSSAKDNYLHSQLQNFIWQLWSAYPKAFQL